MADLGSFAQRFADWRRLLVSLQEPDARWDMFSDAARDVGSYVAKGCPKADAVDELHSVALATGLISARGEDEVQRLIADALAYADETVERVPDDLDQLKTNGHAKEHVARSIPIIFPFPIDGATIPRRPWLVPGLLLRRQLTLMVAPPGSGKSLLSLQLAMFCAAGYANGHAHWGGWRTRGRWRVLIINSEEDQDEMRRRMWAAREVMEIAENDLAGQLCVARDPDNIVVAKIDARSKQVIRTPMLEQIVATIIEQKIDLVIIDPFAETFVLDENSNSELKWAGTLWREVARKTNCAMFLIHHTKKYAHDMAGDPDAGRGGGSMTGVARMVSTLFTMTEKEAEKYVGEQGGLQSVEDRARFIRFDDAKANLTLLGKARWFRKETRQIPNGSQDEPADEVGVLVPWSEPDAFANMTTEMANRILDDIAIGMRDEDGALIGDPYTVETRGGTDARWAGKVVQQYLGCSKDTAIDILAKLVKGGVLEEYEAPIKSSRGKDRKCVRVIDAKRPRIVEEVVL